MFEVSNFEWKVGLVYIELTCWTRKLTLLLHIHTLILPSPPPLTQFTSDDTNAESENDKNWDSFFDDEHSL